MKNALLLMLALPLIADAQGLAPETLKRIKDASVFIVVRGEKRGAGGTGSGFVVKQDKDDLYIVTNDHVIDPDHKITSAGGTVATKTKVQISVVFDSGTATERAAKATVVAADPDRDLAVLKVSNVKNPPQPLDITNPPPLMETMRIFVCGFPFGEQLGEGEGKHPEITITGGGVSSVRKDASGRVASVQIDGSLNPGNSGGPVVSAADGKLVGVAVRSILGSGIGYAVPQADVVQMLGGRPGRVKIVAKDPEAKAPGPATLTLTLIDPLKTVKSAVAHYRVGLPQMKDGEVMPESKKIDLMIEEGMATAEIEAPATGIMMVQIALELESGSVLTTPKDIRLGAGRGPTPNPDMIERGPGGSGGGKPFFRAKDGHRVELPAFPLRPQEMPKAIDSATNLSDFSLKPESYVDKSITVEGRSNCQLRSLPGGSFELTLLTEAGNAPSNVSFVLPKDLGLQLSEVYVQDGLDFGYGLRLEGRVFKSAKSTEPHKLEVSELHFLDHEGKSVTTLKPAPVVPAGEPTLSVLNRFPADFKGKPVSIKAHLAGMNNIEPGLALNVNHSSTSPVRNLKFFIAKDLATQVGNDIPADGGAMVQLDGTVEAVDGKAGHGIMAVTTISVLDAEGKPKKKLEGKEKISLPQATAAVAPKTTTETPKVNKTPSVEPTRRQPAAPEPKPESNLMLYLGIGGGAGLLIIGTGVLMMLKGRKTKDKPAAKASAKSKYQRKNEAVEEPVDEPVAVPAPKPVAKPLPKPPSAPAVKPAAKPKPKGDDNPFANFS